MALERGTEEYQLFTDYWALCKKYWILNDTDEWWERAINDTNRFIEKYKNSKSNVFALKIGTALMDHLENQKNTRR